MENYSFLKTQPEINKEIAGRVRLRRKEKNLSQEHLAARSGVSFGSIKRFERTGEISLSSLVKISFALGCEDDFEKLFSTKKYKSISEILEDKD